MPGSFLASTGGSVLESAEEVLDNRKKKAVQSELRKHVEPGSKVYTDALQSYIRIPKICDAGRTAW